ncbi:hypothetical protein [[Clostridium] innocuum]|uniref:hypothetical protein n=1 Tax=Clostridium innocuum TaxID=1522 RepID=UPI001561C4CF|nr:hypothetical protein [[Clostridium] innocuum]
MMILRLEFVHESERTQLLKKIREDYIIVEESRVTPSKKKNSKKLLAIHRNRETGLAYHSLVQRKRKQKRKEEKQK